MRATALRRAVADDKGIGKSLSERLCCGNECRRQSSTRGRGGPARLAKGLQGGRRNAAKADGVDVVRCGGNCRRCRRRRYPRRIVLAVGEQDDIADEVLRVVDEQLTACVEQLQGGDHRTV